MLGLDPRLIILFCLIFIGVGVFNIFRGRRNIGVARAKGEKVTWYTQINILTGIEYILLAGAFLLSMALNYGYLPMSSAEIIVPIYFSMLVLGCILAGYIIFLSSRRSRTMLASNRKAVTVEADEDEGETGDYMTPEQRQQYIKRRRERRKNAAAARRRRAGKA